MVCTPTLTSLISLWIFLSQLIPSAFLLFLEETRHVPNFSLAILYARINSAI